MVRDNVGSKLRFRRHWLLALAVGAVPLPAQATFRYWVGGASNNNWQSPSNWNTDFGGAGFPGAPANNDDAFIIASSNIFATRDSTSPAYTALGSLTVEGVGAAKGVLTNTTDANDMTMVSLIVARSGIGQLIQDGGTITSEDLTLAVNPGSFGTYNLNNNAVLNITTSEIIGRAGQTDFLMTGGTHTVADRIMLGYAGGDGRVSVSGGALSSASFYLGGTDLDSSGGRGTLSVTGGTVNVTGPIKAWTINSLFELNNGSISASAIQMANWNQFTYTTGNLTLTDDTSSAAGNLIIRGSTNASAITLLGGAVLDVGGTEFLALNSGSIVNFTQNSGVHTIGDSLKMSGVSTATSSYTMIGGTLSVASSIYVGSLGKSTFTHTGGKVVAGGALYVGSSDGAGGSSYTLSGGASKLTAAYEEAIGYQVPASFTQTGGSNVIDDNFFGLSLGGSIGGVGTYSLSGGFVSTPIVDIGGYRSEEGGGVGVVNITGGAMSAGAITLWSDPANSLQLDGGTLNTHLIKASDWSKFSFTKGTLNLVTGGESINAGNFNMGSGAGTAEVFQTGSTLASDISLIGNAASNTANYNQSDGTHSTGELRMANVVGGSATYNLSNAGVLHVTGFTQVGWAGDATFNQTGGMHEASTLRIGVLSGSTGTYNLSGGKLNISGATMTGYLSSGTFTQTGGTHTAGILIVADDPMGTGAYNMSGGTLTTGSSYVGGLAAATFTHSGGTHTTGSLVLGVLSTSSSGEYDLSDTGNLVAGSMVIGNEGHGRFLQTGGTVNVTDPAGVVTGKLAGSIGELTVAAGTFTATNINMLGAGGSHMQVSGTVTVTEKLKVAQGQLTLLDGTINVASLETANFFFARGTINFTGGNSTNTGDLTIGNQGNGHATLNGGSLTVTGAEAIGQGSSSDFTQTGGAHTVVGDLFVGRDQGADGNYTLSGADSVLGTAKTYVAGGNAGYGTFTHSAGTHITGGLVIAQSADLGRNPSGVYNLSGTGNLIVNGIEVIGAKGSGAFNQTGGTHSVNISNGLQIGTVANANPQIKGVFNLSGGTVDTPVLYLGGTDTASGSRGELSITGGTMHAAVKVWDDPANFIYIAGSGVLQAFSLQLPATGPANMLEFRNGGTWRHTGPSDSMNHDFTLGTGGGGVIDVTTAASVLTLGGNGTGAGFLTKAGPGTLRITGSLAGAAGGIVNAGKIDFAASQTIKTLTVNTGATAVVSAGVLKVGADVGTMPLVLDDGTVSGGGIGGRLDLTTRGLIVDYGASQFGDNDGTARGNIRRFIARGYNGGNWAGQGITSSAAAADPKKAVGYALSKEISGAVGGTFMGQGGIDSSMVLVRYTLKGDADLNANVGFSDLVAVAQHYGTNVGATWIDGDFNYDGAVGFSDLVAVAQNYGGALPAQAIPGATPDFTADWAAATASVPEPGSLTVVLAAGVLARRRRRHP